MAKALSTKRSYKELSAELAELLARLEQGDMDIEEAVQCYERGLEIVKQLEGYLKRAENTVTELKALLDTTDKEEEE